MAITGLVPATVRGYKVSILGIASLQGTRVKGDLEIEKMGNWENGKLGGG
jgi:hypothetical protein